MSDEILIDRIARALFACGGGKNFDSKPDWIKDHYKKMAKIAIDEVRKDK